MRLCWACNNVLLEVVFDMLRCSLSNEIQKSLYGVVWDRGVVRSYVGAALCPWRGCNCWRTWPGRSLCWRAIHACCPWLSGYSAHRPTPNPFLSGVSMWNPFHGVPPVAHPDTPRLAVQPFDPFPVKGAAFQRGIIRSQNHNILSWVQVKLPFKL